jgi:hypothetical protein
MAFNFDFAPPAELTGYVREVPPDVQLTLNSVLPDIYIGDMDVAWDIMNRTNRAAMFRAYDAETPITQRDNFERRRVAMPPLSVKTVVGELERLRLEQIRSGGNNQSRMVEAIYDDAAHNVQEIRRRVELARGDVLTDWKFTLAGENGLTLESDFGMPVGHNPVATVPWNDYDDSDWVADLIAWTEAYTNANGEPPGRILTSRTVVGHMLMNAKARVYAGSLAGTPQMLNRQQMDTILAAYDLPPVTTYDTQVQTAAGVNTRVIPVDRVLMLPREPGSLGGTYWGVTAEALELAGGANPSISFTEAPGLVGVVIRHGDPVRTWTKVSALCMPIITNPKRLLVADVI